MNKRKIKDIKSELNLLKNKYREFYGKDFDHVNDFIPSLYSKQQLELIAHIFWLEGYLTAVQDERKKK